MKLSDFKSLSINELWALRERIAAALGAKLLAEKQLIEDRMRKLNLQAQHDEIGRTRRSYPIVLPKYRNPQQPSETWTGRGKQPRWLEAQLKSGKRLDDFRI
jgi:DNA-binding protein H-NS